MTSVKAFHFIGHLAFCLVDNKNSLWIACTADPAADKLHVVPLTTDTGAWGGGSWELSRSTQLGISLCQVRIPWLKPPILWNMQLFYDLYVESMSWDAWFRKQAKPKQGHLSPFDSKSMCIEWFVVRPAVVTSLKTSYLHGLTYIPAWISNYIQYKVWDEIIYPFLNFNGVTGEVWEWISNFIRHFTGQVINYPCWD